MVLFNTSFLFLALSCARILGRLGPSLTQQADQMQFVLSLFLRVFQSNATLPQSASLGVTTETFPHTQENCFLLVELTGDNNTDDNDYKDDVSQVH